MVGKRGRPVATIDLTDEEREALERYVRRGTTSHNLAQRARIILACAAGKSNSAVAAELNVCRPMVGKWRRRFAELRLDGLLDAPHPGGPRKVTDDGVEEIIVRTLETTPKGATHWSTRTMAGAAGVSRETVGRIRRAFGLKPHRADTFQLSCGPLFVE